MNDRKSQGQPALWSVIQAGHALEARLESALASADLSLPKLGVLGILCDAREPMPLSELAEHSHCVRSNMTQLVDRLEADGLVERVGDANDRRIRRAALTAAGRMACERGKAIVAKLEQEAAGALSGAETTALNDALGRLAG